MPRLLASLVAVLAAACILAPASASAAPRSSVLRLTSTAPKFTTVDLGPSGKSPGDIYVFTAGVKTRSGRRIGVLRGMQMSIKLERSAETVQAQLTFLFANGSQIVVGGIGQFPLGGTGLLTNRSYRRPILGGSGRYIGARGELVSTRRADGHYDQTFRFVR